MESVVGARAKTNGEPVKGGRESPSMDTHEKVDANSRKETG